MGGITMILDVALVALLAATMLQAIRLQRALTRLRHDRAALDDAVAGFDSGTRQAEAGLLRLRETADMLSGRLDQAAALRDDLVFLSDRGESLADRLDSLVRAGRALEPAAISPAAYVSLALPPEEPPSPPPAPPCRAAAPAQAASLGPFASVPRVRSTAERELLVAMQAGR